MPRVINFRVSDWMYQKFYALFPGHGERSNFLKEIIGFAIEEADKKSAFAKRVFARYVESKGGSDADIGSDSW